MNQSGRPKLNLDGVTPFELGCRKAENELLRAEADRLKGFCERYDHWMLEAAKVLGWEHDDWNGQDPAVLVDLARAALAPADRNTT